MKAFQETTVWDCDYTVPNHVYFLSDAKDKMYGYVPAGSDKVQEMSTPYRFKVSGRRFREVENVWNFRIDDRSESVTGREYRVSGSGRNVYTVTNDRGSWSCTCPAAKWQAGQCKHVRSLQAETV